jgi:hypothetical protein
LGARTTEDQARRPKPIQCESFVQAGMVISDGLFSIQAIYFKYAIESERVDKKVEPAEKDAKTHGAQ